MANITITIPDDQLAAMEDHLDPSGEAGADDAAKTTNIQNSVQEIVNGWVWSAAKNAAANAVADPTA